MHHRLIAILAAGTLALGAGYAPACAAGEVSSPATATVVELMKRDLLAGPDKEVVMLTVTYPGAGHSLPHRHDAQVFVYVLEGVLTMQVRGGPAVTLGPGETFYESPDDVHVVSANASASTPAKILVLMLKDKHRPASRPVDP